MSAQEVNERIAFVFNKIEHKGTPLVLRREGRR
jgi:hypothetical protein